MPQYQQQKAGHSRVRVLSKDATRAYLLMVKQSKGRNLQVLPNDIYVVDEAMLETLKENNISFEVMDKK